jgi:hypothetical protein
MNTKFDELTKSMAQSVTRRAALKKFGLSLAGMALACFGVANKAEADPKPENPDCDLCVYGCVNGILRGKRVWCRKVYCAAYCQ